MLASRMTCLMMAFFTDSESMAAMGIISVTVKFEYGLGLMLYGHGDDTRISAFWLAHRQKVQVVALD